ncbi:MAG: hypothetical protein EGP67_05865 [Bacteroidales bacterium]|nr:hypothetical protein [Bacteroidales bacterium]CDE40384.1 unknown [Prevotella sp. CAG:279]
MWIWIIVIAVVIGGIWGYLNSNGDAGDAFGGAAAGGCLAAGCLFRLLIVGLGIFLTIWLFRAVFC